MANAFKALLAILPTYPRQVGDVTQFEDGVATVELLGGGLISAIGTASIGQRVFVRAGVIEGQAPTLSLVNIEV
jgi:hypothetical protein